MREYWRGMHHHEIEQEEALEELIEASYHGVSGVIRVRRGLPRLPATASPLLPPRFACHAVLLRAACMIQKAWSWHVTCCLEPHERERYGLDASGEGAPLSPSGTKLWHSYARLAQFDGYVSCADPPPFRFLLRPICDVDETVLPPCHPYDALHRLRASSHLDAVSLEVPMD